MSFFRQQDTKYCYFKSHNTSSSLSFFTKSQSILKYLHTFFVKQISRDVLTVIVHLNVVFKITNGKLSSWD
jgi:hypothetical protein